MKLKHVALGLALGLSVPTVAWAAQAEEAPLVTKSGTIGAPASGKGQVVFFRPGSIMGAALGCTVHEGDQQVARLGSGKYYVVEAEPGVHLYNTRGEAKDEITLEIEEGETYFIRCNIGMGVMAGRANLSPSDRATFAQRGKKLKMWEPKDEVAEAK